MRKVADQLADGECCGAEPVETAGLEKKNHAVNPISQFIHLFTRGQRIFCRPSAHFYAFCRVESVQDAHKMHCPAHRSTDMLKNDIFVRAWMKAKGQWKWFVLELCVFPGICMDQTGAREERRWKKRKGSIFKKLQPSHSTSYCHKVPKFHLQSPGN